MSKNNLVSIMIPVYGVENYIEKCLNSVFANTFIDRCQVIIVNDCTKDNSMAIVEKFVEENRDKAGEVIVINHETNRGLAAARNTAFDAATAEYFICVDSDDWVEPEYIEKLYTKAKEEDADIVGCDLFSEYKDTSYRMSQPISSNPIECIRDMYELRTNGWLWLKMIRRQLLVENNIRWMEGVNLLEDLLITTKCFYFAKKTAYVPENLYHYIHNSASYMGTTVSMKKVEEFIAAIDAIEEFLKSHFEENDEVFKSFCIIKLNVKNGLLFKTDRNVLGKTLPLWPEATCMLDKYRTNKIRRIALKTACTHKTICLFWIWLFHTIRPLFPKKDLLF